MAGTDRRRLLHNTRQERLRRALKAAFMYIHGSSDPPKRQRAYTAWLDAWDEITEEDLG